MSPAKQPVAFLLRHGQTELNAAGLLRGRLDPPLDETGRRQAAALAGMFEGARVARLVSSPLRRAVETAQLISAAAKADLSVDDRLSDRDYGPWAGRSLDDLLARHQSVDVTPGVEALDTFAPRVLAVFHDAVASTRTAEPVVLVAHDAVNRLLLGPRGLAAAPDTALVQPLGCWNRLEYHHNRWTATVVGAAAHYS